MLVHKKKGFTLVELLIVIVVIGVLSAMVIMSAAEAVSTAKATTILTNMRQLKTATIEWYLQHPDQIDTEKTAYILSVKTYGGKTELAGTIYNLVRDDPSEITKYINGGTDIPINNHVSWGDSTPAHSYGIMDGTCLYPKASKGKWFVAYRFPAEGDTRLKQKIAGRAKSLGLIRGWGEDSAASGKIYNERDNKGKFVYMEILDLGEVKE